MEENKPVDKLESFLKIIHSMHEISENECLNAVFVHICMLAIKYGWHREQVFDSFDLVMNILLEKTEKVRKDQENEMA